jgi:hypothetical protein
MKLIRTTTTSMYVQTRVTLPLITIPLINTITQKSFDDGGKLCIIFNKSRIYALVQV